MALVGLARRVVFAAVVAGVAGDAVWGAEIEVFWDKVKQKGAAGGDEEKFVPVGAGPFKDALDGKGLTEIDLNTRHDAAATRWDFTGLPANAFTAFRKFGSVGNPLGAVHMNNTGKKITDLHIRLLNADTFKATSTGGNAFPDKEIKEGGKLLELSGGNIEKDEFLWSKIPAFAQGAAEGKLTDDPPKPKKKEAEKPAPKTGSGGSGMNYTPSGPPNTGALNLSPATINVFEYLDGTNVAKPGEVLNGATMTFGEPALITGLSPDVPGAWDVSDVTFNITGSGGEFLQGTLIDMLLYPDGSQTVLQGTLMWDYYVGNQDSLILDDFFGLGTLEGGRGFFMRSDLLNASQGLTQTASLVGSSVISAIPEPAGMTMAFAAAVGMIGGRRRGRGHAC